MALTTPEFAATTARLALAVLLGASIGFERQWRQKMAGLRTNALVALGAAGFVAFSAMVGSGDPTRVAAQVVSGIGFLGAGVILREGINVHGLNTAATLWCSAMVGTFVGAGFQVAGLMAAAAVVVTNLLLRPLTRRLNARFQLGGEVETQYALDITCRGAMEGNIRAQLLSEMLLAGLDPRRIDSEEVPDTGFARITAQAVASKRNDRAIEAIAGRMSREPHVSGTSWQIDHTVPDA